MKKESEMRKLLKALESHHAKLKEDIAGIERKNMSHKPGDELDIKKAKLKAIEAIVYAEPNERIEMARAYLEDKKVMSGIGKGGKTGSILHKLAHLSEDSAQKSGDKNPAATDPGDVSGYLGRMK